MRTNLVLIFLLATASCSFARISWPFVIPGEGGSQNQPHIHTSFSPSESSQLPIEPISDSIEVSSNTNSSPISVEEGFTSHPHAFGAKHFKREGPEGHESIVHWPEGGLFSEPEHVQEVYDAMLRADQNKEELDYQREQAIYECEPEKKVDYFRMAPKFVGALSSATESFSYSATCFQENSVSLEIIDAKTVKVIHTIGKPKSLFCTDAYFYTTLSNFHIEVFARSGTHKVTFKVTPEQMEEIQTVGVQIFTSCDKTIKFFPDIFKSIWLFLGGFGLNPKIPFFGSKPTPYEVEQNVKFLDEAWGYAWQKRPEEAQKTVVDLDESLIQSGDFFAIIRFDGLDPIIGYGTGSHVGHCTMALRVDGELYVVESQSGWYWPRTNIQINPYKQWVQWAQNAGFHVTWIPLKQEYAQKFDSDAAYAFFKTIEGTPYGYHNFLFGWLDTPDHSYPSLLPPQFLLPAFAIVEKISPYAAQSVYGQGLNKRLGTVNLTVEEIAIETAKRNLTVPDLYAIVEVDGWMYSDGVSYVCSSFVTAMHKAGGLFGDVYVNAVEFTPKDLYQLDFFDPNPVVPENCKSLDPANPFCQIMGKYRMEFPNVSTISIYDHMNEKCWSEGPLYERIPTNC